jgi:hypothetical protein
MAGILRNACIGVGYCPSCQQWYHLGTDSSLQWRRLASGLVPGPSVPQEVAAALREEMGDQAKRLRLDLPVLTLVCCRGGLRGIHQRMHPEHYALQRRRRRAVRRNR